MVADDRFIYRSWVQFYIYLLLFIYYYLFIIIYLLLFIIIYLLLFIYYYRFIIIYFLLFIYSLINQSKKFINTCPIMQLCS